MRVAAVMIDQSTPWSPEEKICRPTVSGRADTEFVTMSGHRKLFQWLGADGEVLLARLALARGDAAGAAAILAEADRATRQHDFVLQVPEVAAPSPTYTASGVAFILRGNPIPQVLLGGSSTLQAPANGSASFRRWFQVGDGSGANAIASTISSHCESRPVKLIASPP